MSTNTTTAGSVLRQCGDIVDGLGTIGVELLASAANTPAASMVLLEALSEMLRIWEQDENATEHDVAADVVRRLSAVYGL